MKLLILSFALLLSITAQSRQLYKIKCYTPSPREDRTLLANIIHLDMIQDDYVISLITDEELKNIKTKTNLAIEVLASFDTEKETPNLQNFNNMLIMQETSDQTLDFSQEYIVSSKSELSININQLLLEKNSLETRSLDLKLISHTFKDLSEISYNADSKKLIIFSDIRKSGTTKFLTFSSSALFPPVVNLTIKVTFL
jgi:hypothetical protein